MASFKDRFDRIQQETRDFAGFLHGGYLGTGLERATLVIYHNKVELAESAIRQLVLARAELERVRQNIDTVIYLVNKLSK